MSRVRHLTPTGSRLTRLLSNAARPGAPRAQIGWAPAPPRVVDPAETPGGLRRAGPALLAYAAVRLTGVLTLQAFAAAHGSDAARRLESWDAQWYAGIAAHGYGFVRLHPDGRLLSDYAFFPLYPMLERLVSHLTGLGYADAGLVISGAAGLAAAWGVFAVAELLYTRRVALIATVGWAALPVAIVQSMAYTESVFTALAAWALLAVLRRRWLAAGILTCLAGATRPVGIAVVVAVVAAAGWAVWSQRRWTGDEPTARAGRQFGLLAAVLIAPLGWLGYVAWVGTRTGSLLGYFDVTSRWGNTFDGGVAFARWTWGLLTGPDFGSGVLVTAGVGLVVALLCLCIRQRVPMPLVVYAGCVVLLALATSGYYGSKPRYLMPAFPLIFPLAVELARRRTRVVVAVLTTAAIAAAIYGALWLFGPGPP
jgi:hypothetical protein